MVGRYFVGDPQVAPDHYWNAVSTRRPDLPLEHQFNPVDPSTVQVLDASPATAWRPLGDIRTEKTTAAEALSDLKLLAAGYGADSVLRLAAGLGSQRTTRSAESFSRYGMEFDSPATELIETSYGVTGTALRRATPGAEAYLGIGCAGYSPVAVRPSEQPRQLVPYVSKVAGPAAAAGMAQGDFIMAWHAEGSEEVLSADCAGLNEAMQAAGPGKTIAFTLWKPDAVAVEKEVRVPHPRIMGADINKTEGGQFRVDQVLVGSPAAKAGLQVGDFLVSIEGAPVTDIDQAIRLLRSGPELQRLGILRSGKSLTVPVQTAPLTSVNTRDIARLGVLVAWVYSAGGVAENELRAGDVLLDFASSKDFAAALKSHGADMSVRIRREGTPREVSAKLEAIPDSRYRVGASLYVRTADSPSATPGPAAPTVEATRGCAKDVDCKGDRICVKGECVDPKPK